MTEFMETTKYNTKTLKDKELVVDKCSKETYRSQTQTSQTALIQRRDSAEAIIVLVKTLEDMDKKSDCRDNTNNFRTDTIGTLHAEMMKHFQKVNLIEFLKKTDRVTEILDEALKKIEMIKK